MFAIKLWIFLVITFILNAFKIRAKLFPVNLFNNELHLPNEWDSVKDCPVQYYDYGYTAFVAPVGGQPAYEREFAHMAAIGWTDENGKIEWNCGGSLISENYIVTAGHCISWRGNAPDVARMGDLNLDNDTDNKWAQQLKIEEVIPHPLYTGRYTYNDIALIKLNGSINVHDTVCPACLWTNNTIRFQFLEACGYGQTGFLEGKTPKLLKVTLSPVNLEACREHYPPNRRLSEGLKDHQICAADRSHIMDTCLGDSGGPLQIKLLGNGKMNPFLIGVTSFGKSCGTDTPGVYTRISSFVDWIESVTNINTDPRKCALKYTKYREFEPDVILSKGDTLEYVDFTRFHVDTSPNHLDYIIEIGECTGILLTESKSPENVKIKDGTDIKIKAATLHPRFISGSIDNDIALIELVSEVKLTEDVHPACLYSKPQIPQDIEFGILGWGANQNLAKPYGEEDYDENEPRLLVGSRSKPINYTYCNKFYQPEGIKIDEESKICYGNIDYYLVPDICRLAPGAPIEREAFAGNKYFSYIIGLPAVANDCGFGFPAIAARVSYYIDWIDSVIFPGKAKEGTLSGKCQLPSGMSSSCKRASDCPHLNQDVKAGEKKLMDYICQFDDARNPIVCCPRPSSSTNYNTENCPTLHRQFRRVITYAFDETNGDEFAHLGLIGYGQTMEWHCRGNLISDKHVLTSNECVNRDSNYDTVALGNFNNVLYGIAKLVYNDKSLTLITLDNVVSFSKSIIPICLWTDNSKIPFLSSFIVSKVNSTLLSSSIRPFQTSSCRKMKIAGSIISDDQSCLKFAETYQIVPICTSPGTGVHYIKNETGLIIPYLVGQLDDVGRVECDPNDEDAEYAFRRIAPHIDWILTNLL